MVCDICLNAAVNHSQHSLLQDLYEYDAYKISISLCQEDNRLPCSFHCSSLIPESRLDQVNDLVPVDSILFLIPHRLHWPTLKLFYLHQKGPTKAVSTEAPNVPFYYPPLGDRVNDGKRLYPHRYILYGEGHLII